MKKSPRKIKQWASEAFESLNKAKALSNDERANPEYDEVLNLFSYCVPIAAMNRGIENSGQIGEANLFVLERLRVDLEAKQPGEPIDRSIFFLLGYLDSHISFGILSERKMDEIMQYLSDNYDI